jgi:hypothetical protein
VTPQQLLAWAQVGVQLVSVLGVPVAQVIAFCRQAGVSDADLVQLEVLWAGVIQQIEARIAALVLARAGQ